MPELSYLERALADRRSVITTDGRRRKIGAVIVNGAGNWNGLQSHREDGAGHASL